METPRDSIPIKQLKRNLDAVRKRMAEAAAKASRPPGSVKLVAVTKTAGPNEIAALFELGVADFGESRVQDAERKIAAVQSAIRNPQSAMSWHLIGHLQTNKAGKAAALFQMIHSLDSARLARTLKKELEKLKAAAPLPCLLEINVAQEANKFGLNPNIAEILDMLKVCAELPAIRMAGLMTMAPYAENPEATSRPVFKRLRELLEETNTKKVYPLPLAELSMGMSQDYPIAIEEGATLVRVGSALFEHP